MRIAVLASSYPRFHGDGAAPFVKSISEQLSLFGHCVEVVAPYDPAIIVPDREMQDTVRVHRFRYIWPERLHIMGHAKAMQADVRLRPLSLLLLPFFLIGAFLKLWGVTGRQKSQIIHVHWVLPNGPIAACVAALRNIPFVISLHGSDVFIARRNRIFGLVARWVFSRAALITACSPELREGAFELGARQVRLLAWGADPHIFHPGRRSQAFRQEAGWSDKVVVTALGRLVHKKGFDRLLKAWAGVAVRYPEAHLVIGGSGPQREALEMQVRQLDLQKQVSFQGQVPWDQVPEFLASSDVFVLPSVKDLKGNMDGLPTVLLEAMSSGLAVVASRLAGIPLVIENGQNGLLVTPDDIPALEKVLATVMIPVRRQSLAQAARRSVEQTYNWENVVRGIEELMMQAVGNHENAKRKNQVKSKTPKLYKRMGTVYRDEMIRLLDLEVHSGRVLDVGSHDGSFLSRLEGTALRVGVDMEIVRLPGQDTFGVQFIHGDGCWLPFTDQQFDYVYAMDVIEHVSEDWRFAHSLVRMLAPGGRLLLSTPSLYIRLHPWFLTGWISRSWGHTLRLGYTAEALFDMFDIPGLEVQIRQWNAPSYRFYYLVLRLLQVLLPRWVVSLIPRLVQYDFRHLKGKHGYHIVEVRRKADSA